MKKTGKKIILAAIIAGMASAALLTGCTAPSGTVSQQGGTESSGTVSQSGFNEESSLPSFESSSDSPEESTYGEESTEDSTEPPTDSGKINVPADYVPSSQDDFEYIEYNNTTNTSKGRLNIHGVQITRYTGSDTDVKIPVKITEGGVEYDVVDISDQAFSGNTTIKSVTVPNISLEKRQTALVGLFSRCSSLEKAVLYIPYIPRAMFYECTSLKEVELLNTNEEGFVDNNAFSGCTSLKEIVFSNHITNVNTEAFKGCTSLEKAEFSGGVEYVTGFAECTALKGFEFKDTKEIRVGAFRDCTGLTEITVPETVEAIDSEAFYNCTNLTKFTVEGKDTELKSRCAGVYFSGTSDLAPVDGFVLYTAGKLSKAHAYAVEYGLTTMTIEN